jgi:hypothetical protein
MSSIIKVDQIQLTDGSAPTAGDLGITGTGKVLQVVQGSTSTQVSSTGTTYVDSGLTASITPTSTSSKILVSITQPIYLIDSASAYAGLRIMRDSTVIHEPITQSGEGPYEFGLPTTQMFTRAAYTLLDSPNTTSSVTYKTTQAGYTSTRTIRTQPSSTLYNGTAYIVLMEIAG